LFDPDIRDRLEKLCFGDFIAIYGGESIVPFHRLPSFAPWRFMRQNFASCLLVSPVEQSSAFIVLSQFQVDDHQFLVVSLETNLDTKSDSNTFLDPSKIYVEIGQFEV
jgi:hypothetical protein